MGRLTSVDLVEFVDSVLVVLLVLEVRAILVFNSRSDVIIVRFVVRSIPV